MSILLHHSYSLLSLKTKSQQIEMCPVKAPIITLIYLDIEYTKTIAEVFLKNDFTMLLNASYPAFKLKIYFTVSHIWTYTKLSSILTFLLENSNPIVTVYSRLKIFYIYLTKIDDFPTP